MSMYGRYTSVAQTIPDGNWGPVAVDANGNVKTVNSGSSVPATAPTTSAYTPTAVSASSAGDNTIVAGTALQTIRVFAIAITAPTGAAVTVAIKDGAGTTLATFQAIGSLVLDPLGTNPRFITSAGNGLILNLSAAVAVTGSVWTTKS